MNKAIIFEKQLDFCNVTIYDDHIYVIMNEGITVIPEYNDILRDLAAIYFKGIDFVYVTHRIHSYSVDPTIYLETSKIKNLKAFIIVTPESIEENPNPRVEKLFFDKPFAIFNELDRALAWKNKMLYDR